MCPDPDTRDLISPQQIGVTEGQQVVGVSLVRVRDPDRISISETEPPSEKATIASGCHHLCSFSVSLSPSRVRRSSTSASRLTPPKLCGLLSSGFGLSVLPGSHHGLLSYPLPSPLFPSSSVFHPFFLFLVTPHSVILSSRFILWLRGRRHLISVPASAPVIAPGTG